MAIPLPIHGRGVALNPANRFETIAFERDLEHFEGVDADDDDYVDRLARPPTQYLVDTSRSILATNDSPDVGFDQSINVYRGCAHGCAYCFARPTHEYLGFSAGLDFESKIMVKRNAPALLRDALMSPRYVPARLAMSGVTDCYQPAERRFELTRRCLGVLAEFRNPVSVITKNHLITRDRDVLAEMAAWGGVVAMLSITTLDAGLTRIMEPRASVPARRIEAIRKLTDAGVPVGVIVAPIVPGLNDHEVPAILDAAARAGAVFATYVPLRLPGAVAPIFEQWLRTHLPDRADKVIHRVRDLRGGKLNDPNFGSRMQGSGIWAEQWRGLFASAKRRAGIDGSFPELSTTHFRRPGEQMSLW